MQQMQELFLQALGAALKNEQVSWEEPFSEEKWMELFRMAEVHQVLPMIYEAVYQCPAAQQADPRILAPVRSQMVQRVIMQAQKTGEFLSLYQELEKAGVRPLVVKGIVCRQLYPNPDYRMSGDEDLLIEPTEFWMCHEALLGCGMELSDGEMDAAALETAYEVPYGKRGRLIYIELHKSLFPPESDAYGDLNRFFRETWSRAEEVTVDGVTVRTLGCTDHLFYLICHAFKHFLHSGFGIRQVSDIVLFANAYGAQIDWQEMFAHCREIRADLFAAALFRIGQKYLGFDLEMAHYPEQWQEIWVDETDLLLDLLDGGIYGDADKSRKHSSNMTLDAVAAEKQSKKAGNGVLKSLFPSARSLEGRYPYLRKWPILLPFAWAERMARYGKETMQNKDSDAMETVKIGNRRIALMKEYGIIGKGNGKESRS